MMLAGLGRAGRAGFQAGPRLIRQTDRSMWVVAADEPGC
jgi:hypothetical protein